MKIWRAVKLTTLNWCTGQVMIFMNFNFTRFGPLSSYLKLRNENIGINVAKLNMKEFTNKMDRLKKKKKAKKQSYETNKMSQKMPKHFITD